MTVRGGWRAVRSCPARGDGRERARFKPTSTAPGSTERLRPGVLRSFDQVRRHRAGRHGIRRQHRHCPVDDPPVGNAARGVSGSHGNRCGEAAVPARTRRARTGRRAQRRASATSPACACSARSRKLAQVNRFDRGERCSVTASRIDQTTRSRRSLSLHEWCSCSFLKARPGGNDGSKIDARGAQCR